MNPIIVLKEVNKNSKVSNKGENILPRDTCLEFKNAHFFQSEFIYLWFSAIDLAEVLLGSNHLSTIFHGPSEF